MNDNTTHDTHAPTALPLTPPDATGVVKVVFKALDAADRAHARAADALHTARNELRERVERGLARAEQLAQAALTRARAGVERADHASADAVIRAQGAIGHVIERARETTGAAKARAHRERAAA